MFTSLWLWKLCVRLNLRVNHEYISFHGKLFVFPELSLVSFESRASQAPVMWTWTQCPHWTLGGSEWAQARREGESLPLFSLPPSALCTLPPVLCPLPHPRLLWLHLRLLPLRGSELQVLSSRWTPPPPQLPSLGFPFFFYLFDFISPDSSYLLFIFVRLCLFVFLYYHFIGVLGVKRKACAQSTRFNQRSKTFHFYCLNIIQLRIPPPYLSPQLPLLNL